MYSLAGVNTLKNQNNVRLYINVFILNKMEFAKSVKHVHTVLKIAVNVLLQYAGMVYVRRQKIFLHAQLIVLTNYLVVNVLMTNHVNLEVNITLMKEFIREDGKHLNLEHQDIVHHSNTCML
jgi:hypothetical protein